MHLQLSPRVQNLSPFPVSLPPLPLSLPTSGVLLSLPPSCYQPAILRVHEDHNFSPLPVCAGNSHRHYQSSAVDGSRPPSPSPSFRLFWLFFPIKFSYSVVIQFGLSIYASSTRARYGWNWTVNLTDGTRGIFFFYPFVLYEWFNFMNCFLGKEL